MTITDQNVDDGEILTRDKKRWSIMSTINEIVVVDDANLPGVDTKDRCGGEKPQQYDEAMAKKK
jgi:hypothetical protein